MTDDHQLLQEFARSQSQEAFRELVDRHLPMVYSIARRVVGSDHLAQEVAQEVFTTLAQKAASVGASSVPGGWLYQTTRYLALHAVRTEKRRREREQAAVAMQSLENKSDSDRILEQLEPAMAQLEEADRDALVLRFFQQRSLRDIGAEFGISEDAARMRVNRALERLRVIFGQKGIAVTSVLLATVLAGSTTTALPAGLAAAITAAALGGKAAVAASVAAQAATAASWLNWKAAAGTVGAALLAGAAVYSVQHGELRRLRADNASLTSQQQALSAQLETVSRETAAAKEQAEAAEADRLELLRLRNEIARPRQARAGQNQGTAQPPADDVVWALDAQVLARNPPVVRIRPSPAQPQGSWRAGMLSCQHGTVSLGTSLNHLLAYAHNFGPAIATRVLMPADAPQGWFDFMDTLPQGGREAMQHLLRDQFGLAARRETRPVEALVMTLKNPAAPGLIRSTNAYSSTASGRAPALSAESQAWSGSSPADARAVSRQATIRAKAAPVSSLAAQLEARLGIPVVDGTGLTERCDYELSLDPAAPLEQAKQAVLDQLGLDLIPAQNQPVEFLVVEKGA